MDNNNTQNTQKSTQIISQLEQEQNKRRNETLAFTDWSSPNAPQERQDKASTLSFSPQLDSLKLEYPALSQQIDTALQQGWDRNKLRRYLAERESIALTQYTPQEINQFLGRDDKSISTLVDTMQKQKDNSYVEIMKYDMSEDKVRDILQTARLSGIAPGVLLLNPDLLPGAEKLAGRREGFWGQVSASIRKMFANYNQSASNKEHAMAQGFREIMKDDETMRQEGLRIWNAGLKTTLNPPPDEDLINMGRESYQKRSQELEQLSKQDAQDVLDWVGSDWWFDKDAHVRTPDSSYMTGKIGALALGAIENFGFTGMSILRTWAGWGLGGSLGGFFASIYNTIDESHSEAGEAFVEAERRGKSPEEAYKIAKDVLNMNLLYLPISNYGQDYVFYKGAELIGRLTNPTFSKLIQSGNLISYTPHYFAGAGKLGKFLKWGVDNAVPFWFDNLIEGSEEYNQELFKMKALGDEINQEQLWEAFKMGMADAALYSLAGIGLNKALKAAGRGASKVYSMTPAGKQAEAKQQAVNNVLQEIRDIQDMSDKIQNGELQPDTIVGQDPVVFLPKSMLDDNAIEALGLQNEIMEDEEGNIIESAQPEANGIDNTEAAAWQDTEGMVQDEEAPTSQTTQQEDEEVAVRKSTWDNFKAQFPEQAASLQDYLREGTRGVTAIEALKRQYQAIEQAVNGNPEIVAETLRFKQELLDAGRDEHEANTLAQATAYVANSLVQRWGVDPQQAMNLAVKNSLGGNNLTESHNQLIGKIGAQNLDTLEGSTTRMDALNKAIRRDAQGLNPDRIWQLYGWNKGKDGQWRFELPYGKIIQDNVSDALSNPKADYSFKLQDIFDDAQLYNAYPQLRNVNVTFNPNMQGKALGFYSIDEKAIVVRPGMGLETTKGTIIHEIQHAIQRIEGFAGGMNLQGANDIIKKAQAYDLALALFEDEKQNPEFAGSYLKLNDVLDKFKQEGIPIPDDSIQAIAMMIYRHELDTSDYQAAWEQTAELRKNNNLNTKQVYKRVAGETEARNATARSMMSSQELKKTSPEHTEDFSRNEQIIYSMNDDTEGYFQILGEKGASSLDEQEGASSRMDNLNIAKQMKDAGKDPKIIRLATGWELGHDGKWRFEIPDDFIDTDKLWQLRENRKNYNWESDKEQPSFRAPLESLIKDENLVKALSEAYLSLPEIMFDDTPFGGGDYNPSQNAIHLGTSAKLDVLLHEFQHFIQRREGFSKGSNLEQARNFARTNPEIAKIQEQITNLEKEVKGKAGEPLRLAKAFRKLEKSLGLQDGSKRMSEEEAKKYRERVSELQRENPDAFAQLKDILRQKNEAIEKARQQLAELRVSIMPDTIYRRSAGEVEARNVQSRMNMSKEQRRNTTLKETEDVPREQQILEGYNQAEGYYQTAQTDEQKLEQDLQIWSENVDKIIDGDLKEQKLIKVMDTPKVFQLIGAQPLPIYMDRGKIHKILIKHENITPEIIKQIPKAITDPIAIFSSATQPHSIVVLTEIIDSDGGNVIVPVHLDKKQENFLINKIASVYVKQDRKTGKPNKKWFTEQVEKGRLLYINNEKNLQQNELQLLLSSTEDLQASIPNENDLAKLRNNTPQSQLDEVRRQYEGTDKWLKAPNGKDTNLTEQQWLLVRTPNFKNWFGDWEAVQIVQNVKNFIENNEPVANITGSEFQKDDTPLVDRVIAYYNKTGNTVVHNDELGDVVLDRRGIKDSAAHGLGKEKAAAFAAVPDVIKHGLIYDRQSNWKGRKYDTATLIANITIDDEDYVCEVVVKKSPNKQGFYLHEVELKKNLDGVFKTVLSNGTPSRSRLIISDYVQRAADSSKVLDENGEPLVVFHVTDANFSVFDTSKARQNMDIPALFFSSGTDDWGDMGRNVMPVFLNMRNPTSKPYVSGNGSQVLQQLVAQGFDGTIEMEDGLETEYSVFTREQVKSATANNGEFSTTNPDIYYQEANNEQNVNARTSWPAGSSSVDTQSIIEFFTSANKSSGFHELAHHVFRVLSDASILDNASDELVNDVNTILKNAGVARDDFFNNVGDSKQIAHEYFAKAFETYLAEGVAPDTRLQGFFDRVKSWLIQVYHDVVQSLGIQLNDDMRDFFNRLMTSPQMLAEQQSLLDVNTAYDTAQIDIAKTEQEIQSIQDSIRDLEENYADMDEYSAPELSDDAVRNVNGYFSQIDDYNQRMAAYSYTKAIADFIKQQGGVQLADLRRLVGKETANDLRKKWPGLVKKNGLALDEMANLLVTDGGFQQFSAGQSEAFTGGGLVSELEAWLTDTDKQKPSKPAPIIEVNTDTLNALLDQFGADTARDYINERRKYLNSLVNEARHEQKLLQQSLDTAQAEIQALQRTLKTSQGQQNSQQINDNLDNARQTFNDIYSDSKVNEADLQNMYHEQREIAECLEALNRLLNASDEDFRLDDLSDEIPEWLANWEKEHPEAKDEAKKTKKTRRISQPQTLSIAEAMKKGYEMAQKYSSLAFKEGQKAGKQQASAKAQQRIEQLQAKHKADILRRELKHKEKIDNLKHKLAKLKENHKLMQERQRERRLITEEARKLRKSIQRMAQSKSIIWSRQQEIHNLLDTYDLNKLGELSYQDIEYLHQQVKDIYDTGRRELAAKKLLEDERVKSAREQIRDIMRTLPQPENIGAVRTREDNEKQYKGVRGLGQKIIDGVMAKTMSAQRFFDFLDNDNPSHVWRKIFLDQANAAYDSELRNKFIRLDSIERTMQQLGIKPDMLTQARKVDVPHQGGRAWTVDELLSIYAGMKNPKSREAILYGNFRNAGNQAEAWATKCIEALKDNEKALADAIIKDYEDSFERINQALIDAYNQGMEHEPNYTPMRRIEYTSSNRTMIDPDAAEHLLSSQSGSGMMGVDKGFTHKRRSFAKEFQNGIQLGLLDIWHSQIELQEHTAAFGQYVRELRRILLGRDENSPATVRQLVKQVYGKDAWDMIRQYFNIVAADDVQNAYDTLDHVSRWLARNMSVAYLCGNLGTILKQLGSIPRVLPHAGAVATINSIGQFLQNPQKFMETCYQLDPQLRNRKGDPIIRALQQESNGIYQSLLKWGSEPIGWADRAASAIVFKAAYDANLKHGLSQEQAVREAQRVVLTTQPATHKKDKPLVWQQHGYARLVMMFSNDMAQTFGITLYDLTQAIRRGEIPKALSTLVGLSLSAAIIKALTSGAPDEPDDTEEWANWLASAFTEQSISSIPLVGKEALTLWDSRRGYLNGHSAFIAPFAKLLSGVNGLWDDKKDNNERAVLNLIEGGSLLAPFPATALRRLWYMLKTAGKGEVGRAVGELVGIHKQDKKLQKAAGFR